MSNEKTEPLQAPPSEWTVEPIRENLSVFETHGHYQIRLSHTIRNETGHIAYVAASEEDAQRVVARMRQTTNETETTGARLTDEQVALAVIRDNWERADRYSYGDQTDTGYESLMPAQYALDVQTLLATIARQEAQIAAMRPLVEALATEIDPEDDHLFCTRCVSTAGRWLGHTHEMVHEPDCIIVKARALLAGEPGEGTGE